MIENAVEISSNAEETRGLARNASIIALGNVASRVLGLVREQTIAGLFGAGAHVDALTLALTIPVQIYELVTGGIVNSALVPVFSEYAAEERRPELWRLASIVLTWAAVVVSLVMGVLTVFTPQVVAVFAWLGQGQNPVAQTLAASLLRVTLPAVIFLSLSGVVSGLLYSLKRFTLPAFTAAMFNASMVGVALLFARTLDVGAMALGLLIGAILQVALQLPALRDAFPHLRPMLTVRHPGLRRLLKLYLPIIIGLIITQVSIAFGLGVAWEFTGGLGWMRYATTLYQFPLGLVATAVSIAILPALARQARSAPADFKGTLVRGLNLVLVLIVPATVGLFILARPIVALVFQHGHFTAQDTTMTALVLQVFLFGLIFAAVDQLLIFAFYARQDTFTPALVGVFTVFLYITTALMLRGSLDLFSLMVADAVKQMTHALVTGYLLSRRLSGFRETPLWQTLAKILLASAAMAGLVAGALILLQSTLHSTGLLAQLLLVAVPAAAGFGAYFALAARLNIAEVRLALDAVRRKLRV